MFVIGVFANMARLMAPQANPTAIRSQRFRFESPLARLTGYEELLRTLIRRELRAKYKGSILGILWTYLNPMVMVAVYTIVFSVLWRAPIEHYPLFVVSGLVVWAFFQTAVLAGTASLVQNAHLVKKVWFPREIIPVSVVVAQTASAGVMFAVIVPANLVALPETARTVLLAIPIFAALVCLTLGLSFLLATAHVFFRDVEHLVGVLLLPLFFLTPVFYGLEQLPGATEHPFLVDLLRYGNPVTPYVEGIRAAIFQGVTPSMKVLAYIFVVGPGAAALGLFVLRRYDDRLAVEL